MQSFLRKTVILVWKDLLIDLRRRDNIPSMLLFLTMNLLIFQFAIGEDTRIFMITLPGIIWVVFFFTGVLGLGKSFLQELESDCLGGLLSSPVERSVLFLGKMLANTLFLMITLLIFIPLVIILFGIELRSWYGLFSLVFFGIVGLSSLGTLLSALTISVKGKELLLPVLIFPLMIPGLLCVVNLTGFLFFGQNQEEAWRWWKLLIGFDVILFTVSLLGFEFVIED